MNRPTCCFLYPLSQARCGNAAEWEILSEEDGKRADHDRRTHACRDHVGALLGPGLSTVYPVGMEG